MTKTKQVARGKIQDALIQLIHEKGLQALTISDITRNAQINRGTFYLYYTDKQDLITQTESAIFQTILEKIEKDFLLSGNYSDAKKFIEDSVQSIIDILEYLYAERHLINALVSEKGDPQFLASFKEIFTQSILKKAFEMFPPLRAHGGIPQDYFEVMTFSSATHVLIHWLSKEKKDDVTMIAHLMLGIFTD